MTASLLNLSNDLFSRKKKFNTGQNRERVAFTWLHPFVSFIFTQRPEVEGREVAVPDCQCASYLPVLSVISFPHPHSPTLTHSHSSPHSSLLKKTLAFLIISQSQSSLIFLLYSRSLSLLALSPSLSLLALSPSLPMAAVVAAVEAGIVQSRSGKRRGCGFYWRLRAEILRQVGRGIRGKREKLSFHYDPFSYALNFDDGCASAFLS
jgi:hypothetical protein